MKVEQHDTTLNRLGEYWIRSKSWRERYHLKPMFSVMMYIVIPLVAIYLIMHQYPLLAKERFYRMIQWIMPIGMVLFALSLIQERFKKGTLSRLGLDGMFVGLTMFWLFGFLGGQTVIQSSYAGWGFSVDVTPIVIIVLFGTSLNIIRDFLEYQAHKQGVRIETEVETDMKKVEVIDEDDLVTIYTSD